MLDGVRNGILSEERLDEAVLRILGTKASLNLHIKANALEVYNALNRSDYTDPEAVELVHLEKGVSLSIRNDASYIIDMNFSFYEHQSTYNRNMPLRSIIYFVNALDDWLKENEHDLFGRKRIMIPTPHFVVFYNGTEKRPEYEEMRLSKSFYHQMEEPETELICKAYNINPQNNEELKRKSSVLNGYTYFVEKVRDNQRKKMNLKEAIDDAIEDCIQNHILEDFFRNRKDEVRKMTHLDYTWEKREKLIRKEEYEDGRSEGMSMGISKGSRIKLISQIIKKMQRGKDILSIADEVEESVEVIQPIYEAILAAPGADAEQIYETVYLK